MDRIEGDCGPFNPWFLASHVAAAQGLEHWCFSRLGLDWT
jgi:hypothetical protein